MSTFLLREEHIKLLNAMQWQQSDSYQPVPQVDAKRPFGFSHSYEYDAAEIVGVTPEGTDEDGDPILTDDQEEQMRELIEGAFTALLVILSARSFRTGRYYREDDGTWHFVRRAA